MSHFKCTKKVKPSSRPEKGFAEKQKILVVQQNGSGEKKIEGIRLYGGNRFDLEIVSIDVSLPTVIDDTEEFIPQDIRADLVIDYLKHPDLSYDLAKACRRLNIPVVASGKKMRLKGVMTPPT